MKSGAKQISRNNAEQFQPGASRHRSVLHKKTKSDLASEVCELQDRVAELETALSSIIVHQRHVAGETYKMSAIYRIASEALDG